MTQISFYGGVNEIGGNKILVDDGSTRVMLDFGLSFSRMGDFYEEFLQPRTNNALGDLLALDVVPKLDGIYRQDLLAVGGSDAVARDLGAPVDLWRAPLEDYDAYVGRNGRPAIDGVVLSHANMDHYQHICLLDERIPIYCSPMTRTLIQAVEEMGRSTWDHEFLSLKKRTLTTTGPRSTFPGEPAVGKQTAQRDLLELPPGETRIGTMSVRPIAVDHSVPGAVAVLLTTGDHKRVLYSGDLRFHGRRDDWTQAFLKAVEGLQPDAFVVEGTRITEEELDSEHGVQEACERLVHEANRRGALVLISFAWKDTSRYLTVREVAQKTDRMLVISAKLAYAINLLKDHPDSGLGRIDDDPSVRVLMRRKESMFYSQGDYIRSKHELGYSVRWEPTDPSTIDLRHHTNGVRSYDIRENPSLYIVHLDFFELSELIDLQPPPGSIYIRAQSEPFNEEMRLDEERLKNWLRRFGINAPDHEPLYVHTSGHASGPEIRRLVASVNPRVLFPIHTEHPDRFSDELPTGIKIIPPEYGVSYPI